ncbi:unnamed protein product, partial [Rotaria sp. Silwood2]
MGKILQISGPKTKFRLTLAIIVNGIKQARNKSAHAKFTKYLLFVNLIGPREPNITKSAAVFPSTARTKIINDILFIIHSPSLIFEEREEFNEDIDKFNNKYEEFRC